MSDASRFIAYKVSIADILASSVQEGVLLWNNRVLGRANIIGVVISVQKKETYQNVFVDDGTGSIALRVFDAPGPLFQVGNAIRVIGRLRIFGQERYISPEAMNKLPDSGWIAVRKKEISLLGKYLQPIPEKSPVTIIALPKTAERCVECVKQMDTGEGVEVDDLLAKDVPEEIVYSLIKEGIIFEIKPGRVKVLD